jgi:hypothetical protein
MKTLLKAAALAGIAWVTWTVTVYVPEAYGADEPVRLAMGTAAMGLSAAAVLWW